MHPARLPALPMNTLVFACRRCGSPIDLGAKAALMPSSQRRVLLDCACSTCGQRALYAHE